MGRPRSVLVILSLQGSQEARGRVTESPTRTGTSSDASALEETSSRCTRGTSSDGNDVGHDQPQRDHEPETLTAATRNQSRLPPPRLQDGAERAARLPGPRPPSPRPTHALWLREAPAHAAQMEHRDSQVLAGSRDTRALRAQEPGPQAEGPSLRSPRRWARGHCSSMVPPVTTLGELRGGPPGTAPSRPRPGPRAPLGRALPCLPGPATPAASGKRPPTRCASGGSPQLTSSPRFKDLCKLRQNRRGSGRLATLTAHEDAKEITVLIVLQKNFANLQQNCQVIKARHFTHELKLLIKIPSLN